MANVLLLIVGSVAAVSLILLLAWREITLASGQPISTFVRWLTIVSVLVFVTSIGLRLAQLLTS